MSVTVRSRSDPLAGRVLETVSVRIAPAAQAARVSLRAGQDAIGKLSQALELELPVAPCTSASGGGRAALWLGPDEWLVVGPVGDDLAARCRGAGVSCSAVDVCHRNVAFTVSGPAAEVVLAAGCPQDLSARSFPAGACSRTVFGKIEVVIWRTDGEAFRIECWRSFAEYLFALLEAGVRDAVDQAEPLMARRR